jgi:hypothetical protein
VAHYSVKRFGGSAVFDALAQADKELIFADIVQAAGRSRGSVNALVGRIGKVSRGLLFMSIGISVYEVMTSDTPLATAGREAGMTGAGVLGGMAGGALAGLACGPGAPVCVTIGAFVGGAAAVLGLDMLWD